MGGGGAKPTIVEVTSRCSPPLFALLHAYLESGVETPDIWVFSIVVKACEVWSN